MKIISLNTFGGNVFEPLMQFVEKLAADTDVFCFQEIMNDAHGEFPQPEKGARLTLLKELVKRLPDFQMSFMVAQEKYDFDANEKGSSDEGLAIFVRNGISIVGRGNFFIMNGLNTFVPHDYSTLGSPAMFVQIPFGDTMLTICNVHGNSEPANKLDSPARLLQSKKIIDTLAHFKGEKMVMGDFNLFPDTESIKMFEPAGYKNLIKEYEIATTRGSHMRKLHPQFEHGKYGFQDFADYTFVTPGINVKSFEVPDEPISDHLPMIIKIEG
ncbi:MAG: endonuclease/exonuclease/phosphatase family protein [Patescibacteria group bacterium]|jgi:exonuclease III